MITAFGEVGIKEHGLEINKFHWRQGIQEKSNLAQAALEWAIRRLEKELKELEGKV